LEPPREPRSFILVLAVGVVAAAVFATAITGPWIYDDIPLIADNPYIKSMDWWVRWWTTDFWHVDEDMVRFGTRMVYWRPLISGSYAVDWQIGGGSPVMFHVTNTLAQGVVGALGFLVLRRWIGSTWPAFAAALLFAVHPTKAESVAWIAGRTDVFCMIGVFVATIGVGRRLRRARGGIALEVVGTLFAYTTKEQAIVLPAFVAVEVWVAAGRPAIDRALVWKILKGAAPQVAVAILYFVLRALWMPIRASNLDNTGLPIVDHAFAVLETMGRFIALAVAPYELSIQQGLVRYGPDRSFVSSAPYVLLGLAVLVLFAAAMWFARKKWPVVTIGLGFYLVTLAPTSNLMYTQMMTLVSERFLYLPLLGLVLVAGSALARVPNTRRFAAYAAVALVIGLFSIQSLRRSADYANAHEFWARELALHPGSKEARAFLIGVAIDKKQYPRALALLKDMHQLMAEQQRQGVVIDPRDMLDLTYQTALIVANMTPDRDVATLRAIDAFAASLLAGEEAHLATSYMTFTYPKRRSTQTVLDKKGFRGRLLVLRASIASRLADDTKAFEHASAALAICERCLSVAPQAALTLARAGRYVEALELFDRIDGAREKHGLRMTRGHIERAFAAHENAAKLTGPAQLQQWAQEMASLEMWGRAYAVLAPHKDEIKRAPRFALGFAELAYRAGDTAVAREVLATQVPAAEVDTTLDEWASAMGWK
jgi:tetratricopeptide (TPR) repeat protein